MIIRFFKGALMGAVFGIPAAYCYNHGYNEMCLFLLVCAVLGGILVDLEVI